MAEYRITDRVVTYCQANVTAESPEAALARAKDDGDWSYETDYDESLSVEVQELRDGQWVTVPTPKLEV